IPRHHLCAGPSSGDDHVRRIARTGSVDRSARNPVARRAIQCEPDNRWNTGAHGHLRREQAAYGDRMTGSDDGIAEATRLSCWVIIHFYPARVYHAAIVE